MRKKLLLYFISVFLSSSLFPQDYETKEIKAIKESLARLSGTSRVDGMITLCEYYFKIGFFGEKDPRPDSIFRYATDAKMISENLKYNRGVAHSKVFLGFVYMTRGTGKDTEAAKKELKEALSTSQIAENIRGYANAFLGAIYSGAYSDHDKGIEYLKVALKHFQNSGNTEEEALTCYRLADTYQRKNDLVNAVDYCGKALRLSGKIIKTNSISGWADYMYLQPLTLLQQLYRRGGDYTSAKQFVREADQYAVKRNLSSRKDYDLAIIYLEEGKYDSAVYHFKIEYVKNPVNPGASSDLGKAYLGAGDYVNALKYFQPAIDTFRSRASLPGRPNAKPNLVRTLIVAAKSYYLMQNYNDATKYASEGLTLLNAIRNRFSPTELYELLADAYQFTSAGDSSLIYFKKYTALRDSVVSKQFLFQLHNLKRQTEDERKEILITLLQKDNLLKQEQLTQESLLKEQRENVVMLLDKDNKLTQQQLKEEEFIRRENESQLALVSNENTLKGQQLKQQAFVRYVLIGSIGAMLLIGAFAFRILGLRRKNEKMKRERAEHELQMNLLENEKKQVAMQQHATELEMQALRAQMNPHFIFNCLSSINLLILENNTDAASDYLTRFSRLIRMILSSSEKTAITLEEDIQMLELYLKMEQLRLNNKFEYRIQVEKNIEPDSIVVPPLLMQPVCENAIWHGLQQKENGQLNIDIKENEKTLFCIITDNGAGRKKDSVNSSSDHKPMGVKLTAERLALFNNEKNGNGSYEVEDLTDEVGKANGTRVVIKIKNYR